MSDQRAERLAEVERLSRRPHAQLHSKLLDSILSSLDRLTPEEWQLLARRSPDRLVQALAMSGKLAGDADKSQAEVSSDIEKIMPMSDAEMAQVLNAEAAERLARLAQVVPAFADVIHNLDDAGRKAAIQALGGHWASY